MTHFCRRRGERLRFQQVVTSLQWASARLLSSDPNLAAGMLEYCLSTLEFINALVNTPEDLRVRVHLRGEFLDLNLERVLQVCVGVRVYTFVFVLCVCVCVCV